MVEPMPKVGMEVRVGATVGIAVGVTVAELVGVIVREIMGVTECVSDATGISEAGRFCAM
jgi:hypothetical protein